MYSSVKNGGDRHVTPGDVGPAKRKMMAFREVTVRGENLLNPIAPGSPEKAQSRRC